MRVLCFGDNITQGFWGSRGGWVEKLVEHYSGIALKDLRNNNEPEIFNLGISGDITAGVLKRFEPETEARKWRWPLEDFAFIFAVGINDSIMEVNKERSNPENYAKESRELIIKARKHSDKILFLGLTPCEEERANTRPDKVKEFINQRILAFDNSLKRVCEEEKVVYLPLYQKMQEEIASGQRLFDDGLHPNDAGHELIFELVRPELDKLLAK